MSCYVSGDIPSQRKIRLSARDEKRIINALRLLERGHAALMHPGVMLGFRKSQATTTIDFVNQQGECCCEIDKTRGSAICLIETGISALRQCLNIPTP